MSMMRRMAAVVTNGLAMILIIGVGRVCASVPDADTARTHERPTSVGGTILRAESPGTDLAGRTRSFYDGLIVDGGHPAEATVFSRGAQDDTGSKVLRASTRPAPLRPTAEVLAEFPEQDDYSGFNRGTGTTANRLVEVLMGLQGAPYVWGAQGPDAFDCSGLVQYAFSRIGLELPRVSRDQARVGEPIAKESLAVGDLVFFANTYRPGISHVGVYIGGGKMVHASSGSKKVTVANLAASYFRRKFALARRILYQS